MPERDPNGGTGMEGVGNIVVGEVVAGQVEQVGIYGPARVMSGSTSTTKESSEHYIYAEIRKGKKKAIYSSKKAQIQQLIQYTTTNVKA